MKPTECVFIKGAFDSFRMHVGKYNDKFFVFLLFVVTISQYHNITDSESPNVITFTKTPTKSTNIRQSTLTEILDGVKVEDGIHVVKYTGNAVSLDISDRRKMSRRDVGTEIVQHHINSWKQSRSFDEIHPVEKVQS